MCSIRTLSVYLILVLSLMRQMIARCHYLSMMFFFINIAFTVECIDIHCSLLAFTLVHIMKSIIYHIQTIFLLILYSIFRIICIIYCVIDTWSCILVQNKSSNIIFIGGKWFQVISFCNTVFCSENSLNCLTQNWNFDSVSY
jgi:hypothetical protein